MEYGVTHFLSGLLGGLGGISGHVFDWLGKRTDAKHAETMARIRIDEVKAEADAKVQVAVEATRGVEVQGDIDAFKASYRDAGRVVTKGQELSNGQRWVLVIVDGIHLTFREFLTLAALGVFGWAVMYADSTVASQALHLAVFAFAWWFGSRHYESAHGGAKASFASQHPAAAAWGVSPEAFAQLEADQKKGG